MGAELLAAVEAAYAGAATDADWRSGIFGALAPLDTGQGIVIALTSATPAGPVALEIDGTIEATKLSELRELLRTPRRRSSCVVAAALERLGFADVIALDGSVDATRRYGAYVPLTTARATRVEMRRRLRLVGLHLAAGRRARDQPPTSLDGARADDSIPDWDKRRELWEGIRSGRWSLVGRFEQRDRRYLVARRNPPDVALLRALTEGEADVICLAAAAPSQKYVAYTLGISDALVSRHLVVSMLKVGVTNRTSLFSVLRMLGAVEGSNGGSARAPRHAG